MTNYQLTTLDLPALHRRTIGFDQLFRELNQVFMHSRADDNYPPHNVIKLDDDHYVIEVAVAGFSESEIDVELEKNRLTIRGEQAKSDVHPEYVQPEYVHKGISSKSFEKSWPLAEHVEVRAATVKNGILSIALERLVPEEAKPKKIAIDFQK